ncbi:MAG: Thymidylate kinase [Phylliscum demangeonii]|nr:MAG: Thymidylate kinase [Phylliscum demangeonii]
MSSGNTRRGLLVVLEGLDRSGKSTQCARLVEALELLGIQVRGMRFPDRTTPIGQLIDRYLNGESAVDDHAIHLLFSANRWEAAAQMRAEIQSGITLVLDRYYYSGCVYSAAKHIPALDLEWARWPEVGLPAPDLCVFLDVPAAEAQQRGGFGQEKYETWQMQDRVRTLFAQVRETEPAVSEVVDAGRPVDEVADDVLEAVLTAIRRLGSEDPLSTVQPIRPVT